MEHTIEQQLRDAVDAALAKGWSMNALAKAAGVSRSAVRDWHSRSRGGLAIDTIQGLAAFFGMRLTKARIPKPPA